jgi:hypothetical protein
MALGLLSASFPPFEPAEEARPMRHLSRGGDRHALWGHGPSNLHTWQHGASAADPIIGTLHGSAVAIASARFIPEILSTGNAIDVRL